MQLSFKDIQHVYIANDVRNEEVSWRAQKLFASSQITFVDNDSHVDENGSLTATQFNQSKKELYITQHKGHFFKRCPGSKPGLTCCNYFVLNLGQQCNMNCSYCYLQSFINSSVMKLYANIDQALDELREMGLTHAGQSLRIGTGEVIDSLSLDPLTLYSRKLITFFRDYPNWKLEFKTKSSYVDQFLDLDHAGNIIVSFSVNPQYIIEREEHGTASLQQRVNAARIACDRGHSISFHLDPVIYHPEWRESYKTLVDEITNNFKPVEVPIMSLGALRFQPQQRHMMRERFGMKSLVTQAEMYPGADGKLRYDQSLREEMYEYILGLFKAHSKEWRLFLCMETPETWLGAMGAMPKKVEGLSPLFEFKRISQSNGQA